MSANQPHTAEAIDATIAAMREGIAYAKAHDYEVISESYIDFDDVEGIDGPICGVCPFVGAALARGVLNPQALYPLSLGFGWLARQLSLDEDLVDVAIAVWDREPVDTYDPEEVSPGTIEAIRTAVVVLQREGR